MQTKVLENYIQKVHTSSCFASGVRMPSKLKLYRSLLLLTGLQQLDKPHPCCS
jgi:hypothetical protein